MAKDVERTDGAQARAGRPAGAGGSWALVLGFACYQAFALSLFYLGENVSIPLGSSTLERVDLVALLAFLLVSLLAVRALTPRARAAVLSMPLLWCYAVLLVAGSLLFSLAGGPAAALAQGALVGLPLGLTLCAWGRALGAGEVLRSIGCVFVGSLAAALLCFAAAVEPFGVLPPALKLLPLGSALALQVLSGAPARPKPFSPAAGDGAPASGTRPEAGRLALADVLSTKEQRETAARLSVKIVWGTLLFGMTAGFMETFASEPGGAALPGAWATFVLLALFCAAAVQLIESGGFEGDQPRTSDPSACAGRLEAVYRLAILVMMAGFLFVPMLEDFSLSGASIVLAGYLGLFCVLVCLYMVMSAIEAQDAALSFSLGFASLYGGELLGVALGNLVEPLGTATSIPYVASALAGLCALFAYLFLFTGQDFHALSAVVRTVDRLEAACEAIARDSSLSARESEILSLALRGRSGERIASELFISKSTVDTHLRRIYAKTGVHGRQELIDLAERTMEGLG